MRFADLEVGQKFSCDGEHFMKLANTIVMGEYVSNNVNCIKLQGRNVGYHGLMFPNEEVQHITYTGVHAYDED